MICLGIDPDLHTTGLAIADEKRVYAVAVARVPRNLKSADAAIAMCQAVKMEVKMEVFGISPIGREVRRIVVEGQQAYIGGSGVKATPADLLNLANVTGAALAATAFPALRPLPREWKGSVPKEIHQARIVARFPGLDAMFDAAGIAKNERSHVIDAIGLAAWGAKQ